MEPAQTPPQRSRLRRLLPGIVAAVLVVDMVAAIGTAVVQSRAHRQHEKGWLGDAHARALPSPTHSESPTATNGQASRAPTHQGEESRRAELIRALLAKRARAVRTHDRQAFLATVEAHDAAFRAEQRRLFENLAKLPLATWEYEIRPGKGRAGAGSGRSSPNVWTPRLVLRHRLVGFDQGTVTTTRYLTFARTPLGWRVTDVAQGTVRRIWDLGELTVVHGQRSLILGIGATQRELREIARRMDRAVPAVSDVWGTDWSRGAVVLRPRTQQQAVELSPDQSSLDQITAIATVMSGPRGVPPAGTGDRIIVNPANFSHLSSLGRRVVLRHEVTHVATRAATDSSVPMWLIEGFADYIGYRRVDMPASAIALELGDAARSGDLPRELPTREDFSGTARHLTRAYESAWLACTMIAEHRGERSLVHLYQAMGSEHPAPPDKERTRTLRRVLSMTPEEFTAQWRSYVRAELE